MSILYGYTSYKNKSFSYFLNVGTVSSHEWATQSVSPFREAFAWKDSVSVKFSGKSRRCWWGPKAASAQESPQATGQLGESHRHRKGVGGRHVKPIRKFCYTLKGSNPHSISSKKCWKKIFFWKFKVPALVKLTSSTFTQKSLILFNFWFYDQISWR